MSDFATEGTKSRRQSWVDKPSREVAATDYLYSLSGKTREREVNVPLINSMKLSDRRIKRSAQVQSVKKGVGDWISVGYSVGYWRVMFRTTEYVTVSHSAGGYSVTSVSWRESLYKTTIKKFLIYTYSYFYTKIIFLYKLLSFLYKLNIYFAKHFSIFISQETFF